MSVEIAQASSDNDRAVTESDAARRIGYSKPFLRKARRHNRGPAFVRIGRSIRYRIVDLDQWLAAHLVQTRESGR